MTLRIAVVGSVLAPFDAISNDIVSKVGFLRATPGWQVSVLAMANQRSDIDAKVYGRVSDLLLAPDFLQADVIIYHFGIYYPSFDAILIGNGRAKQAVVFHNITPLDHVPPSARSVIRKSFAQLEHLHVADAIWPDSRENRETLLAHGMARDKMTIQPLAVDRPARQSIRKPGTDAIRILFIGRIVPSKGLHDLIEAIALMDIGSVRARLKIIGDLDAAEPAYREKLLARIDALGLADRVEFAGAVSNDERDRLLGESHVLAVPSYHEGFCVPVIEALRAGLVPVVYSAHNLRYIADGLCVSTPPGDVASLASALASAVTNVAAVHKDASAAMLRLDRGRMSVAEFESSVGTHLDGFEPQAAARSLCRLVRDLVA